MKTTLDQVMQMTDEEVNISLASACPELFWISTGSQEVHTKDNEPVDLTQSLDALQPIKEGLTDEQLAEFGANCIILCREHFEIQCANPGHLMKLPAHQQSRALIAAVME